MAETGEYIEAWCDEDEAPEHPIVAELRARPGRWAILRFPQDDNIGSAWRACNQHPNIEVRSALELGSDGRRRARWRPQQVFLDGQSLRGILNEALSEAVIQMRNQ